MRLAIASTTLLFAMMAAQAAVLPATSNTDVNLVKRAPTNGAPLSQYEAQKLEELYERIHNEMKLTKGFVAYKRRQIEQSEELIKKLTYKCQDETTYACIIGNASIAAFEKEITGFKKELEDLVQDHERNAREYRDFTKAKHESNYGLLRDKYLSKQ
ncbi:hypothetical protein BASA60_007483 [Batrachochytrium salamandrivorans]|nr:hypothetical protein BASA60_007483 [Batrachochytrium salamandrivorans]